MTGGERADGWRGAPACRRAPGLPYLDRSFGISTGVDRLYAS